jgi:hypothetical protein
MVGRFPASQDIKDVEQLRQTIADYYFAGWESEQASGSTVPRSDGDEVNIPTVTDGVAPVSMILDGSVIYVLYSDGSIRSRNRSTVEPEV